jgi:1-acyl-sn-glycerol-3-phosphate acyltransferase
MFYQVAKAICRTYLFLVRRWKILGPTQLPPGQGLVLVANHTSYLDPVIIGCVFNRRIYFMAKAELFKIPGLSWIITKLGAFPVQRQGVDRVAIRRALELLTAGEVVGIFPEGTRSATGELLNPHLGAAMLAAKGGMPLLPVAVSGAKGFWGQVNVNVGKPMDITTCDRRKISRTQLEEASRDIMSEISRLLAVINK